VSAELRRAIRNDSDASRIVLESTLYARQAGFDEVPARLIATAVSELARNILKYAGTGEVCLRHVEGPGRRGVEIEATDHGPGIADCEAAMRDHYSSGGTLGLGLPGVRRMMDDFLLRSTPATGTRVRARKWL
jgi:serine/threonine-protein kinase RsbT